MGMPTWNTCSFRKTVLIFLVIGRLHQCQQDGIEKSRQEIADANFGHVQQINCDGDNE
jgi:hypothetical protein